MENDNNSKPRKIYSGNEANQLVRRLAANRVQGSFGAGESVSLGIDYFDEHNAPLMRGEVMLMSGLTSHGKTLFASGLARHTLDRLGNDGKRGVLIVMTEETVEARRVQMWGDARVTIRSVLLGRTPLELIDEHIEASTDEPVYFLGNTTRLEDVGTTNGIIRPSTIGEGLATLMRLGISPELVIVDHAHDLEPDRNYRDEASRFEAVGDELKQLANALTPYCPLAVLTQCNKDVEKRPPLEGQPNAYDIKFMQGLIARARDVFSIYYPTRQRGNGLDFPTARGKVKAIKGTFLVHAAKARNGTCAGDTLAMTALDDNGQWCNHLSEVHGGF